MRPKNRPKRVKCCWIAALTIREPPDMMSTKFLHFFDPLPPCPHLDLIYTIKLMQPPLLHLLFHDHLPPPMQTDANIISGTSLNLLRSDDHLPEFSVLDFSSSWLRDMHREECGADVIGLCDKMKPIDGEKLLQYLRNVNFVGEFGHMENTPITVSFDCTIRIERTKTTSKKFIAMVAEASKFPSCIVTR